MLVQVAVCQVGFSFTKLWCGSSSPDLSVRMVQSQAKAHRDQLSLSFCLGRGAKYSAWLLNGHILDVGWVQMQWHRTHSVGVEMLAYAFTLQPGWLMCHTEGTGTVCERLFSVLSCSSGSSKERSREAFMGFKPSCCTEGWLEGCLQTFLKAG